MSPQSYDNGWTDRNADCCVNTTDEKITKATNWVNFRPVTFDILWLICMSGWVLSTHMAKTCTFPMFTR